MGRPWTISHKKTRFNAGFDGLLSRYGMALDGHLVRHPASHIPTEVPISPHFVKTCLASYRQSYRQVQTTDGS